MSFSKLPIVCDVCKFEFDKNVELIAPESFAEGKKPEMISSFWCPNCKNPQVIKLRFFRDESGEVRVEEVARLQPTSAFVASPGQQAIQITARNRSKRSYTKID